MAKEEHAKSHMGKHKSASHSKKHEHRPVHKMHIRHAANGGHIVEHEFAPEEQEDGSMMQPPSEEHVMPASEGNQMLAQHVAENMQPPAQGQEPPPAPAGGAPMPAGPTQ